jgi:hypothetical protein
MIIDHVNYVKEEEDRYFFVATIAEPRSPQGNPDQPDVAFCFMSVLALQLYS